MTSRMKYFDEIIIIIIIIALTITITITITIIHIFMQGNAFIDITVINQPCLTLHKI